MPVWLINLLPVILHWLRRWASVILISIIIFAPILIVKNYLNRQYLEKYNLGYKTGYSQAVKDRPTYGHVDTVINNPDYKYLGMRINLWKLRLGLGL